MHKIFHLRSTFDSPSAHETSFDSPSAHETSFDSPSAHETSFSIAKFTCLCRRGRQWHAQAGGRQGHRQSGFTLIEVMVAILILTVALLGVAGMAATVIHGNAFSKECTTAATLAQDKMEELKNLGYPGMPSSDTTTTEDYNSITDYPAYKRVTDVDVDSPAADMKTIEVRVEFPWKGNTHNVTLKTIVAR